MKMEARIGQVKESWHTRYGRDIADFSLEAHRAFLCLFLAEGKHMYCSVARLFSTRLRCDD